MRAYSLLVIFSLFSAIPLEYLQAQWTNQKQPFAGLNLNAISCIDFGSIYIACDSAAIINSTEAGFSWNRSSNVAGFSSSIRLTTICFLDTANGWVAGTDGSAARTTNAGSTWSAMTMADTTISLNRIRFADVYYGWAAGNSSKLQYSSNGGSSWSVQTTFAGVTNIADVFVLPFDTSHVWVCGSTGFAAKSIDGGLHWSSVNTGTLKDLFTIKFIDANTGWLCGKAGTILYTVDGGSHWISVASATLSDVSAMLVSTDGAAIIADTLGMVYETYDYGNSWRRRDSVASQRVNSLSSIGNMIYSVSNSGYIGIGSSPMVAAQICLTAFRDCLNKINQGDREGVKICSDMFIACLRAAPYVFRAWF